MGNCLRLARSVVGKPRYNQVPQFGLLLKGVISSAVYFDEYICAASSASSLDLNALIVMVNT